MMNELIERIAAQTGVPVESVAPVVGAMLSHLGDVLPAPIAHEVAILLGVHRDDGQSQDGRDTGPGPGGFFGGTDTGPGPGGFLGGMARDLTGGGTAAPGAFAGADSLMNIAQSLLGGFLSGRR